MPAWAIFCGWPWAGLRDVLANLMGADPVYLPIAGRPGELAAMSTPDALAGYQAIAPADWRNQFTARSALTLAFYRPGRRAARLPCATLMQICEHDAIALPETAEAAFIQGGTHASALRYRIGHFDIYRGPGFRQSSADQLVFFSAQLRPTSS